MPVRPLYPKVSKAGCDISKDRILMLSKVLRRLRTLWRSRLLVATEWRWSVGGVAVGGLSGLMLGGVGIAFGGNAFGLPGIVVGAVLGLMVGNRLGIQIERWASNRTP